MPVRNQTRRKKEKVTGPDIVLTVLGVILNTTYVKDEDVDEFDKGFPPKEKQKLPGQIFG